MACPQDQNFKRSCPVGSCFIKKKGSKYSPRAYIARRYGRLTVCPPITTVSVFVRGRALSFDEIMFFLCSFSPQNEHSCSSTRKGRPARARRDQGHPSCGSISGSPTGNSYLDQETQLMRAPFCDDSPSGRQKEQSRAHGGHLAIGCIGFRPRARQHSSRCRQEQAQGSCLILLSYIEALLGSLVRWPNK